MEQEKKTGQYSCVDCAVTECDNSHHSGHYPAFCVSQGLAEEQRAWAKELYAENDEDRRISQVAAGIEADGYGKWPRVKETILFAKRMGYHKIGIATCVGLIRESRTLAKILRLNGFEVYAVGCKIGELSKAEDLGVPEKHLGPGPAACNPVLQARLLNEAGTDLNIVVGLCVGHDSLFYKYAEGVTTTLVVKDRAMMHNPVLPLYGTESYCSYLMKPIEDGEA